MFATMMVNAFSQWWDDTCGDLIGFGMNQMTNGIT
jgi:hypothetical protein